MTVMNLPARLNADTTSPLLYADSYMPAYASNVDVSTQLQTAINAANVIGASVGRKIPLLLTPGRTYLVSEVQPASFVDLWCYGAKITRNPNYATNHPIFFSNPSLSIGSPVTDFAIRALTVVGTGTELSTQGVINLRQASQLLFEECSITGVASAAIFVADSEEVRILKNRLINCGASGGTNVVALSNGPLGNTNPLQNLWVSGNKVLGAKAGGIIITSDAGANRTDSFLGAHITDNTITTDPTGFIPLGIEMGGGGVPPNLADADFSGNTCIQNSATGQYASYFANDGGSISNDPLLISALRIRGNRFVSQVAGGHGMSFQASRSIIEGNWFDCNADDIRLSGHGTATIDRVTIGPNSGGLGTGLRVRGFTNVDLATLSIKGDTPTPAGVVAVPATGVAVAAVGYDRYFYVLAGAATCTMAVQNGPSPVIPASGFGSVYVPAGNTVTPTYAAAPTWTVQGT